MEDNIITTLCDLFAEYGSYLNIEDNYQQYDIEIPTHLFDSYGEASFEEIAEYILEKSNYEVVMFAMDKVFDSPGLDVYVLSIVAKDKTTGKIITNLHNVYERY